MGHFNGQKIINNDNLKKWENRTIDKLRKCQNCWAIFICGGGCGKQAVEEMATLLNRNVHKLNVYKMIFCLICSKNLLSQISNKELKNMFKSVNSTEVILNPEVQMCWAGPDVDCPDNYKFL